MIKQVKEKACANKKCTRLFKPFTSLQKYCSGKCKQTEAIKPKKARERKFEAPAKRKTENAKANNLFERNKKEMRETQKEVHGHNFCQRCKRADKQLSNHHIVYRSEKPNHPNLHDIINQIIVCDFYSGSCHDWYHAKKSNRNELVVERGLDIIFGFDILNK